MQYDPTKWMIYLWKVMGVTYGLKKFPSNEIKKGQVQQAQKKLNKQRMRLEWGTPLEDLPTLSWDDYIMQSTTGGKSLVAIAEVIHDVSDFISQHPGGKAMIKSGIGRDATALFNGGIYDHSNAAHNLLSSMCVAVLRGGGEVEIWKRSHDDKSKLFVDAGLQVTKVVQGDAAAMAAKSGSGSEGAYQTRRLSRVISVKKLE